MGSKIKRFLIPDIKCRNKEIKLLIAAQKFIKIGKNEFLYVREKK